MLKEIDLYKEKIKDSIDIGEVHFGGGTPSLIPVDDMRRIIDSLKDLATGDKIEEISIEIDPRTCDKAHLQSLIDIGFNRFSFGVQDFNQSVQEAIGRIQGIDRLRPLVDCLIENKITAYNFDLIIGLPKQNIDMIKSSLDICKSLNPSRLALYSYAHMPEVLKNQKLIKEEDLPSKAGKLEMIEFAREYLKEMAYVEIGMDHFALPNDSLVVAREENNLHRNFMGYSIQKSKNLIGLGLSSISDFDNFYYQNAKDLKSYEEHIEKNELPISKTHKLTQQETKTKSNILDLFCKLQLQEKTLDLNEVQQSKLKELESDKLISKEEGNYQVSLDNIAFIRYIAKTIDPIFRDEVRKSFSSSV